MRNVALLFVLFVCIFFAGCSLLDNTIPVNPETGYREPTQITKDVAEAVPYGSGALAVLLFISNAVIFVQKKRTGTGLMSTVRTIEAASKDPEMKEMIAKLKLRLAESHKQVNVTPLINTLLSKIKLGG